MRTPGRRALAQHYSEVDGRLERHKFRGGEFRINQIDIIIMLSGILRSMFIVQEIQTKKSFTIISVGREVTKNLEFRNVSTNFASGKDSQNIFQIIYCDILQYIYLIYFFIPTI